MSHKCWKLLWINRVGPINYTNLKTLSHPAWTRCPEDNLERSHLHLLKLLLSLFQLRLDDMYCTAEILHQSNQSFCYPLPGKLIKNPLSHHLSTADSERGQIRITMKSIVIQCQVSQPEQRKKPDFFSETK